MKSVSHLITTIERGGAENQLLVLVQEQVASGWKVEVIPLKGSLELKEELINLGAQLNLSLFNKSFLKQIIVLRTKINNFPPLLHAHLPRAELIAAISRRRKTFIFTRHNAESFIPTKPGFLSVVLSRLVAWRASRGIAISHAVKDFILEAREIPKKYDVEVIHYGYNLKNPVISKRISIRNQSKSRQLKAFRVGIIGRLVPQKDYPTLLKAFADFSVDAPLSVLQIIGSGYLEPDLKNLSIELGIVNRVEWIGKISNVFHYLEMLDLFVLTSLYEGFGLVLLEAMDASVPILASRNSAIPEVLGDEYPGLFETSNSNQLAKKMLEIYLDLEYSDKLIDLYSDRLSQFGAANMWRKVEMVYNRV